MSRFEDQATTKDTCMTTAIRGDLRIYARGTFACRTCEQMVVAPLHSEYHETGSIVQYWVCEDCGSVSREVVDCSPIQNRLGQADPKRESGAAVLPGRSAAGQFRTARSRRERLLGTAV
jgi:hypothetical protein